MTNHFIKIEYKIEDGEPILYLFGRDIQTLQKKMFRIVGFKPYFYVPENEQVPQSNMIKEVKSGFKSIFEQPLKKVVVQLPSNVKELRKYFTWTGEADIPFTRRFLIDLKIKTLFETPDKDEVHYTELKGS